MYDTVMTGVERSESSSKKGGGITKTLNDSFISTMWNVIDQTKAMVFVLKLIDLHWLAQPDA